MKKGLAAVLILSLGVWQSVYAQERLAILPLRGTGVDDATRETVYLLLQSEIARSKMYAVVPETDVLPLLGDRACSEAVCAIEVGTEVGAAKVVFGSLNKLGEKIIFQYGLVDVPSGTTVLTDDLSALRVEDLDQVTKRIATSIVKQIPVHKTVEVGDVTEQESLEPSTRKASSSWGIGFGYLYPQKGYDDDQRIFVFDFRSLYEMRHVAIDALLGIRQGAALNIGVLYLPSRKDFSPYVGAGLGFHAVSHERVHDDPYYGDYQEDETSDGVELLIKGGLLALRTYDFRVVATVEYSIAFNDYDDSGIVVTIGMMRAGKRIFGIF
jgi:TolB-like protein